MTHSLAQLETSARNLLRNGFAQGLDDKACVDWAVAALGEEHRKLVQRVFDRHFKIYGAN